MILENLKTAGVQKAHKEDKITFTALTAWPGELVCAEGNYLDWYPGDTGQPMTRSEFEAVERELSTYFGEPYGFLDDGASRVSVATF
jgi:adenine-specific DNA-methyltransferase